MYLENGTQNSSPRISYFSDRGTVMPVEDVNILLSTYNGEKYLAPLLKSLVSQTYRHLKFTIRDDGSSDSTLDILEKFAQEHEAVKLIKGKNIGVLQSYFMLLQEAEPSGYYAFCDQDDVWLEDKVERAIDAIRRYPEQEPVLYCSGYALVDENLSRIGKQHASKIRPGFSNALVENIATGCTIVLNRAAREVLIRKIPQKALMHDWWSYLVISALGTVIYDPVPSVLYRQHSSNAVGVRSGFARMWLHRLSQYRQRKGARLVYQQVAEFYDLYGQDLDEEARKITEQFLSDRFWDRLKAVLAGVLYRQSFIDNLIFKVLYLSGKI